MKILTSTPLKYSQNTYPHKNNTNNASFGINPIKTAQTVQKQIGNTVTDGLAYGFGWLGTTKPVQKLIDALKDTNYQRHLSAFVGVVLSSFYMLDTAKSKKIEKDQKMPLIINQGTVCALSTAGAYTLDKWLDKKLANFVDTIAIANISDPNFQKEMIRLHANKDKVEVLEETAKVLKTPEQMIDKKVLDVIDDSEKFAQLKDELKNNKYAKKLFAQLETSENPKQLLQEHYNRTDLFENLLNERFQLNKRDILSLEKMVRSGTADETVTTLVDNIHGIAKEEKDKFGKATEFFMKSMKKSPILSKMFTRNRFQGALDILAESDSQLSLRTKGFRFAKSMMVFAMIYRFISPVFATPVANAVSTKIEAHKKSKVSA